VKDIRVIFREETVRMAGDEGRVRRYEAYEAREGGFIVYIPGSGSPKEAERVRPNPKTLKDVWSLLERGYRLRTKTADGKNAVFSLSTGLRAV
jgi:hypothetical protein